MNDEPNYYAIIPANIRYDKNLTANAKLLYAEITALCQKEGYCWATNKYFQELYGVSQQTVSEWVRQLVNLKVITIEMDKKNNRRYIRLLLGGDYKKTCAPLQENLCTPLQENLYRNNTSVNNTSVNNSKNSKKVLIDEYFNFGDVEEVREIANTYEIRVLDNLQKFLINTFFGQEIDVDFIQKQAERFSGGTS